MKSQSMVKFLPYNVCTECEGELVAIQTETNILNLDKKGKPINIENLFTTSKLVCTECGRVSDVNIVSTHFIEKGTVPPLKRRKRNPFGYLE